MDSQRLTAGLQQLHAMLTELVATEEVPLDNATKDLMRAVQRDLQKLVGPIDEAAGAEARSVTENLREAMVDFEAEHPQLTSLVGRLSEALANLGI